MNYDKSYLETLITDKIEESIHLDYKAAGALERIDAKTNEISKDVSAFANSDGGIIVYGLKEDVVNKNLAGEIDPVIKKDITKEWLEQIIQSSIQPRLENVRIHPIRIDIGQQQGVVYVVEIPKSNTAHQARDKRYYRRFNFNSEPMHDYEIKDILNRVSNPFVNLDFAIHVEQGYEQPIYNLIVYATNQGSVLAKYINCYVTIPTACFEDDTGFFDGDNVRRLATNTVRDIIDNNHISGSGRHSVLRGPSRHNPLLPKMKLQLKFDSNIEFNKTFVNYDLTWIVYADNASPVEGRVILKDIPVSYLP